MSKFRKYISLFLFYTLLIGLVSGVILYIAPHGKVATYLNWTIIGLDKHQWADLHTVFGLIMLLAGFIHLYFNWRPFVGYIKSKASSLISKQFFITSLLTIFVIVGTLYKVPPFGTIIDAGEYFKKSWESEIKKDPKASAQIRGYGRMSLKEVQESLKLSDTQMSKILIIHKIENNMDQKIRDIASQKNLSPYKVYELFSK